MKVWTKSEELRTQTLLKDKQGYFYKPPTLWGHKERIRNSGKWFNKSTASVCQCLSIINNQSYSFACRQNWQRRQNTSTRRPKRPKDELKTDSFLFNFSIDVCIHSVYMREGVIAGLWSVNRNFDLFQAVVCTWSVADVAVNGAGSARSRGIEHVKATTGLADTNLEKSHFMTCVPKIYFCPFAGLATWVVCVSEILLQDLHGYTAD